MTFFIRSRAFFWKLISPALNTSSTNKISPETDVDIAKAMGVDISNLSNEEAAKAAVNAVRQLAIDVSIPQTLREINIPKDGIPKLSIDALNDVCTGGNPKDVTLEDIEKLYHIAY